MRVSLRREDGVIGDVQGVNAPETAPVLDLARLLPIP